MTDDLRAAHDAGLITAAQRDALISFFDARSPSAQVAKMPSSDAVRFDIVHLLWYAGALIVIGAMGLFTTLAFSQMGGGALTVIALVYATLFWWAGHYLWTAKNLRTPGGLLIAVAISMVPLAVYGIQDALNLWGEHGKPGTVRDFYVWIKGSWIFMEIVTIAVAAMALRFYRFPFIVVLPAIALWFMSMDIVPWIVNVKDVSQFEIARRVSIVFGLGTIVLAVVTNARQRSGDFAFWLYLFGVVMFWGGITATSGGTTLGKAIYCALNVSFLFLAVFLGRPVFAVFGTIGIAIIAIGLYGHRHRDGLYAWFDAKLPEPLRRLRPARTFA